MGVQDLLLFLGCALVAETIGTMAGFGAATILTPVAMLFMDAKTAIAVVACFHLFGNLSRLVFFGRNTVWTIWAQFGLTAIVCSILGACIALYLPSGTVQVFFGVFLIVYVVTSILASGRLQVPRVSSTLIGGGLASGFIAGLLGTGGAIRSACLLAFGLPKEAYIGTSAAIVLVVDLARLPVYIAGDFIPRTMIPVVASLLFAAFAGAWIGQRLVKRVSTEVFRRFVLAMLTLAAVKLILSGFSGGA